MDLRLFEYVCTLSDEKSFSKASSKLGIAQSTLSQYIKKLEQELGTVLFDRSASSLKLTASGKEYVKTAEKILEMYGKTLQKISDVENSLVGSLNIGIAPSRATYLMPDVLPEFKTRFPNIAVNIVEGKTSVLYDELDNGGVDFCVTAVTSDMPDWYMLRKIGEERIVFAVSPDAPFYTDVANTLKNGAADLSKLGSVPFINLRRGQILASEYELLCDEYGIKLKNACNVTEITTAVSLAAAGLGALIIPEGVAKSSLFGGKLKYFPLDSEIGKRSVAVVYKKNAYLSKAALALIEIIENRF